MPSLRIKPSGIPSETRIPKRRLIQPIRSTIRQVRPQTRALPIQQVRPRPPLKKKFTTPVLSSPTAKFRSTVPAPSQPGERIDAGKLNFFLSDKGVTMIECPGPNKLVLVKKAGRVNLTKMKLTQEEIDKIIENFSKAARIPVVGGVFKAIVGNLSISAVISGFVGSRFIVYKTTPYSLIEQH